MVYIIQDFKNLWPEVVIVTSSYNVVWTFQEKLFVQDQIPLPPMFSCCHLKCVRERLGWRKDAESF